MPESRTNPRPGLLSVDLLGLLEAAVQSLRKDFDSTWNSLDAICK